MLALIQPSYGVALTPLSAQDPTVKQQEKLAQGRHAATMPSSSMFSTGCSEVSVDTMVEAALTADSAYGLISTVTTQDVTEQYAATERLLSLHYDGKHQNSPKIMKDI